MPVATVHLIAAARPNFMKVAPLYHALKDQSDWCAVKLVHTGQHYDPEMSDAFFADLMLPEPDFHLGVGSGTHAEQTAGVMVAYERICLQSRPDWVVVVGDVNSTVACSLVCAKLGIRVAHLEAGLRSRDRSMPEEINRIVTDALADLLWTPSPDGDENLRAEGIPAERIERIGNVMIDSYEMMRPRIEADGTRTRLQLEPRSYAVVTLHRPVNVDKAEPLAGLVRELVAASSVLPIVFPVHPRTRARLSEFGLLDALTAAPAIRLIAPLPYIAFMNLVTSAAMVVTDSGGVQEETTYLGIPCRTVRDTTERPITVTEGTNELIQPSQIYASVLALARASAPRAPRKPDLWDGRSAHRAAASLRRRCFGTA